MARDGGKDSVVALEEWYSLYLNTAENELLQFLKPLELEPVHLEAAEIRVAEAMEEMTVVGGFCSTCQSMFDNWPDFRESLEYAHEVTGKEKSSPVSHGPGSDSGFWTHPWYGTMLDLPYHDDIIRRMASTRNGCKFCAMFTSWLEDVEILDIFIEIDRRLHKLGKSSQLDMAANSFDTFRGLYEVSRSIRFQNTQPTSTWLSYMNLAKHLTQTCLDSHEMCNISPPTQYPSRLLSLTGSVRLVATEDWTSTPRYATLSHSWGSQKFETLRLANLEQMLSWVPEESLTKTFVDAVGIARAAGLNYLWIDSLCIIQDDYRDWEAEAAKMASVYSGTSLNIAASSAKDGTEGCFPKPRNQPRGFLYELPCRIGRSRRSTLTRASWKGALARICRQKPRLGRFEFRLTEFVSSSWYRQYVSNTHLASRAWCLQEMTLAPRTLHCTNAGLFWECRTARATEDFPNGFFGVPRRRDMLVDPGRPSTVNWRPLVERYSACDLTYPGDKLIAISGIARAMMDKGGNQYFAGLWREHIDIELCWTVTEPRPRPRYRAPSWSWTAVDGPTKFAEVYSFSRETDVLYGRVYSVSVKNTGADPCGAVAHGVLTLDCDMVRKGTVTLAPPGLAGDATRPTTEAWVPYADLGHKNCLFRFRFDCSEDQDKRLGQVIYFLPLGSTWNPHEHYPKDYVLNDFRHIFGLVVEEVDSLLHEYRRIGHFEYHSCERCDHEANESPTPFFRSFEELLAMEKKFRGGSWVNLT